MKSQLSLLSVALLLDRNHPFSSAAVRALARGSLGDLTPCPLPSRAFPSPSVVPLMDENDVLSICETFAGLPAATPALHLELLRFCLVPCRIVRKEWLSTSSVWASPLLGDQPHAAFDSTATSSQFRIDPPQHRARAAIGTFLCQLSN